MALINDPHPLTHRMLAWGELSIGDDYSDSPPPHIIQTFLDQRIQAGVIDPL